jgi:hypothetical protein
VEGVSVAERILVPFAGEGSGVDELSWGQEHIWQAMRASGSSLAMTAIRPLAPDATVEEFVDELRFYMSRFEVMRTRLRLRPDGRTLQVVESSGEVALDITDADPDADPDKVAQAVSAQHYDTPFDYQVDWPVRMTLVRQGDRLTHMVMTLSHHAADATAAMVMFNDMLERDPVTGAAAGPVAAVQPLELARLQRGPSARRQSEAALRYWEETLRAIPARRFAEPEHPFPDGHHRHWRLAFTSRAMFLALRQVAAQTRADATSALLALYSVALARVAGRNPVVSQLLVNNRFRPGFDKIVGPLIQAGLCVVDVAGVTFDQAVHHARRRSMTAYKNSYYDRLRCNELIGRIGRERGEELDLGCIFNDRRRELPQDVQGPLPTEAEVRAAQELTTISWDTRLDAFNERLMMNFNNGDSTVAVEVTVDTCYLPPPAIEAYLRELEAVSIEAGRDLHAPTGVPAP